MCRKSIFPACLILTFGLVNITLALGLAIDPYPPDGAIHPDTSLTLSWTPGDFAVSHDVYFGADYDAVANADTSDPEGIYRTSTEENSYVLPEGSLEWGQTYFWRIDEINPANPDSPWTGDVWSFTVTASDFYYNGTDEQIALSTAVDYLAVRLEPRIETESFIDLLQGLLGDVPWQRVDEFPQYRTVLFWFGEEPSLIDREHLEQVMLETGQVEVLSPVFRTAEEAYLLILTDEFLARFHPEIPLKQIEALNLRLQTQIVEEDLYEENKFLLKLLPGAQANVLDIANIYHNNNMTVWAAPNFLSEVHKWFVPNDPYFKEQWHLENTGQGNGVKGEDVDAVKAWDHTRGDSSIVIAIIDDGVDYKHEDLAYNIFENLDEASYNNIDDDNNGYTTSSKTWMRHLITISMMTTTVIRMMTKAGISTTMITILCPVPSTGHTIITTSMTSMARPAPVSQQPV